MMSNTLVQTTKKSRLSVRAQALAALTAIAGAVAAPQLFHAVGAVSGLGSALGETFLPMHLPIILVGLLAGPGAGAVAGLLGPAVSFALSGMPTAAMLPFMMVELCAYGLFAGLLRDVRMPVPGKVLAVQVGGRAVRAAAVLLAVYAFGSDSVRVASIWTGVVNGLFGLTLQWALIPPAVYRAENGRKYER